MNRYSVRAVVASLAAIVLLAACSGGEPAPSAFPGILVDGRSAYLASNLDVYKFDTQTGVESWRFPGTPDNANPRGPFSGVPLKFGNTIVVGGSTGTNGAHDSHLYALSDESGQEVWRFTPPGSNPKEFVDGAVSDGKLIFAPNGDGNLYAIDPSVKENNQPKIVWTFTTGNRLWNRPLLADGKLYQGAFDHKLYAIDAATGKELWRFEGATAPIAAAPSLQNGVLYFGAFDSVFYAVSAADGQLKWKVPLEGWVWTEATLNQDTIFFGDVQGKLYALDIATGQRKWTYVTRDAIKAQPVLSGTMLYVVSEDTNVYALDISSVKKDAAGLVDYNATAWRNETIGRRMVSKPTIVDNTLFVPIFDGDVKVWSLDASTGSRKFQFPLPPPATPTPVK